MFSRISNRLEDSSRLPSAEAVRIKDLEEILSIRDKEIALLKSQRAEAESPILKARRDEVRSCEEKVREEGAKTKAFKEQLERRHALELESSRQTFECAKTHLKKKLERREALLSQMRLRLKRTLPTSADGREPTARELILKGQLLEAHEIIEVLRNKVEKLRKEHRTEAPKAALNLPPRSPSPVPKTFSLRSVFQPIRPV